MICSTRHGDDEKGLDEYAERENVHSKASGIYVVAKESKYALISVPGGSPGIEQCDTFDQDIGSRWLLSSKVRLA